MASKPTNVSDFKVFLRSGDPLKIFDAGIRNKWNYHGCSKKIAMIIFYLTIA